MKRYAGVVAWLAITASGLSSNLAAQEGNLGSVPAGRGDTIEYLWRWL